MTSPVMLSKGAEASICWTEHKKELSDLVENGAFYEGQLKQAVVNPDILSKLAKNFSGMRSIKYLCGGQLTHHRREKLNAAEKAQDKLLHVVEDKMKYYFGIEQKIRGEIELQFGRGGREESPELTLKLLQEYKDISRFAQLYGEESLGKSFYLELAKTTELLSDTSYTAIVSKYTSSNTKEELQQAQQSLGKNVWKKVEAEKERLQKKYSGKLSKAETEFIKALPGKKWGELDAEMSKVVAHADEYLGKKGEMERETKFVQHEITELSEIKVKLTPDTISKVKEVGTNRKQFENSGTIYLEASIHSYYECCREVEELKKKKIEELSQLVSAGYHQLKESFDRKEHLDSESLDGYLKRADEFRIYGERLNDKALTSSLKDFKDKLKCVGECLKLTQKPESLPKVIVNIPHKGKEASYVVDRIETKPIPLAIATPLPLEITPKEAVATLNQATDYSIEQTSPFPPLITEMDLTLFAFNYMAESKDSRMSQFCQHISGFNKKGDFTTIAALSGRIKQISPDFLS
ncbi:MAG: hypothetical protein AABY26_06045 [Nanoarchaeota archaeon]